VYEEPHGASTRRHKHIFDKKAFHIVKEKLFLLPVKHDYIKEKKGVFNQFKCEVLVMDLIALLLSSELVCINKKMAKKVGYEASLLITEILKYFVDSNVNHCSIDELMNISCMNDNDFKRAINKLLKTQIAIKQKNMIMLDFDKLSSIYEEDVRI